MIIIVILAQNKQICLFLTKAKFYIVLLLFIKIDNPFLRKILCILFFIIFFCNEY